VRLGSIDTKNMKKFYISLFTCLSLLSVSSAFAFTVSPSAPITKNVGQNINISGAGGIDNFTEYYSWWTTSNVMVSETLFHLNAVVPVPSTEGTYRLRLTSYATGGTFPIFTDFVSNIYTIVAPPPPPVETMIGVATSSFMAMTGFTPAQSVSTVGNIFIKPIIGGGLMMLQALLPWIIGLVLLSAFVYSAYRFFRLYKH
jgi:hypothetical protein